MVAKYRVVSEFFYGDRMLKAGYAGEDGNGIKYEGEPGPNLEPMNDEAKEAFAAAEQRRTAKRDALVTGEAAGANAELLALVRELSASNVLLEQRVKTLEGANANVLPPEAYATKAAVEALTTRVDGVEATALKLREDVDEHDEGLTLHEDRLVRVEGIVNRPAPPESPAPTPPAEPPADTTTGTTEPPPPPPTEPGQG